MKIPRCLKIISVNFIFIIILFFLSDLALYVISEFQTDLFSVEKFSKFYPKYDNPDKDIDYIYSEENEQSDEYAPRKPYGLKYKTDPILLLGCSFAYGNHLKDEETFGYKLSELLKRPVFNKAISAFGLQYMYYLTTTDYFYNQVPPCETVIYLFINDHFRRLFFDSFFLKDKLFLHYEYKNGKFVMDNYDKPLSVLHKKSYSIKALRSLYYTHYMNNTNNYNEMAEIALLYFVKMRENLENHWHRKFDFIVFFYEYSDLSKFLCEKLQKNNFKVVVAEDLTDVDLFEEETRKYKFFDSHPNEAAWNLLTPLFVNKLKQDKVL